MNTFIYTFITLFRNIPLAIISVLVSIWSIQPLFTSSKGKYFINLFLALDKLVNTLAGGDWRITVSARVGYYSSVAKQDSNINKWLKAESMIDTCFLPIDGPEHCLQAYNWYLDREGKEKDFQHGNEFMLRILLTLVKPSVWLLTKIIKHNAHLIKKEVHG